MWVKPLCRGELNPPLHKGFAFGYEKCPDFLDGLGEKEPAKGRQAWIFCGLNWIVYMQCLLWTALGIVTETPHPAFSAGEELEWIARPEVGFLGENCDDGECIIWGAGLVNFVGQFIEKTLRKGTPKILDNRICKWGKITFPCAGGKCTFTFDLVYILL